jgi:site-specific DNA recombinase
MRKAAIYARVSTERQEKEKTIESQIEELRRFCEKNGFLIVKEYVDDGWSGETLARPALDQLRDDASKKLFEVVCIHSPDRLARKFIYQGLVIEELKKKGIEVIFLNRPISDTPEDQLLLGIQGLIAEYEKAKILERTRRGRIHKAKEKGIVGSVPPYGYNYIKKTPEREGYYEVNEDEARVVRLIFDLYLKLQSLHQVKKELYRMGIKTRKGSLVWADSTIHRILTNEAYTGIGYYNRRQSIEVDDGRKYKRSPKTGRRLRDRSEWIPIKFPAIIDEQKFRLTQQILEKRFKPYGKSKYPYLLSGLVKCANCGYSFAGDSYGRGRYNRCNNRHRRYPQPKTCDAKYIKAEELENAVWNAIANAISNPKILISHISALTRKIDENEESLRKERETLIKEKNDLTQKKDKLIELYTESSVSKEQFLKKMKDYDKHEQQLEEKIKDIGLKISQVNRTPLIIKNVKFFCDLMKKRLFNLNQKQKQQFLRYIVEKIIFDSNKREAKIIGHIPLEAREETISNVQSGTLSIPSWNRGQCPNNSLKFELKVKV